MLLLRVNKFPLWGFFKTGLGIRDHTTWPGQEGLSWGEEKKKKVRKNSVQEVMRFMFPAAGLF